MGLPPADADLHEHAYRKVLAVLGDAPGRRAMDEGLRALGLSRVQSLQDLERLAAELKRSAGFRSTVGAMLAVDVAMLRLRSHLV